MIDEISIEKTPDNFARISEIAARLGVKPCKGGPGHVLMQGADGNYYDVFEVVSAVLDKLDNAIQAGE